MDREFAPRGTHPELGQLAEHIPPVVRISDRTPVSLSEQLVQDMAELPARDGVILQRDAFGQ